HATELVSPHTFRSLSGSDVRTELFASGQTFSHIDYARESDLYVVAPASANFLGKACAGIADDLVTTTFIAADPAKTVIAPAMNYRMYTHPVVQQNMLGLRKIGCRVIEADSGALACGDVGKGRFPSVELLFEEIVAALTGQDLAGMRLLVSAGPTREPLDPVRYLSNRSSGRMGYALARIARRRGADVTLVSGPAEIAPVPGIRIIPVETAREMKQVVTREFKRSDCYIAAAAVSDFRPAEISKQKIKKSTNSTKAQTAGNALSIDLSENPDIVTQVARTKIKQQIVVGFALETENLQESARMKLKRKHLDMIVGNTAEALGQAHATAVLCFADGTVEEFPDQDKELLAYRILDAIVKLREKKHER
ncbi:MAG TPA: bifunctional phosphopantothenoylcysteine decarboxylase/phosphopantothenate--cysteine ligase CoaBC, partial [bacterium]|nr:bifunctional phosphopantothenoylcysteine decarboxylase/phosphopantothenate--cysteine ligase CoaBC [bacterium]